MPQGTKSRLLTDVGSVQPATASIPASYRRTVCRHEMANSETCMGDTQLQTCSLWMAQCNLLQVCGGNMYTPRQTWLQQTSAGHPYTELRYPGCTLRQKYGKSPPGRHGSQKMKAGCTPQHHQCCSGRWIATAEPPDDQQSHLNTRNNADAQACSRVCRDGVAGGNIQAQIMLWAGTGAGTPLSRAHQMCSTRLGAAAGLANS